MTSRNRCRIAGANGPILLTIPIAGGRDQKALMKEIRIDHSVNWQARHWKTISSAYNKSPWFEFFRDELAGLYTWKCDLLVEWNRACLQWVADKLSIRASLSLSGEYLKHYPEAVADYRSHGLSTATDNMRGDPLTYPQVFDNRLGFLPHLSILDWLFCMGSTLPAEGYPLR